LKSIKPKPLLRVQLGEHHDEFIRWCLEADREPATVIKHFVDMALANLVDVPKKGVEFGQASSKRLRINLGEKHIPFAAWCSEHNLVASTAVKNWILRLLAKEVDLVSTTPRPKFREETGVRDESRVRVVLRMSRSEVQAWEAIAEQSNDDPNKLMRRVLRSCVTKNIGFSANEAALLGTHNLLLLRVCNNLNQIARHVNAQAVQGQVTPGDAFVNLTAEVAAVRAHVEHVSRLLSSNRERWLIAADI
jgi:hypothetical protein